MPGILYIVATPIGNLADASPRALEALREADLVACEDTRTSRGLLAAHGIAAKTTALHAHNEREAGEKLLRALREGSSVALVSDAGTPAVSDPGALLVAAAHREGIRVVPIPGPNAAIAAWSASGFIADSFRYVGFLPARPAQAARAIAALDESLPLIFYEAPHRVAATVAALLERFGPERELVIARELTKKFEEIARMKLAGAPDWLEAGPHRQQGEFVLVLGPGEAKDDAPALDPGKVLGLLLESLPASEAAKLAARITGAPRNALYREALGRIASGTKAK
ncbi:MAG: 16S rRNA (cytidine(1402)-2'-O)-methyltransferase [Betaproteobacteria bacterium]